MNLLSKFFLVLILIIFGLFVFSVFFEFRKAYAADYREPDVINYYDTLKQPDDDTTGCCGPGDVYQADKTDNCNPSIRNERIDCALVAIITDTRPDEVHLQNGRIIRRAHIPVGTRIPIPHKKIRKHPIPNPTEHNIIFVKFYEDGGSIVYCWEPAVGI